MNLLSMRLQIWDPRQHPSHLHWRHLELIPGLLVTSHPHSLEVSPKLPPYSLSFSLFQRKICLPILTNLAIEIRPLMCSLNVNDLVPGSRSFGTVEKWFKAVNHIGLDSNNNSNKANIHFWKKRFGNKFCTLSSQAHPDWRDPEGST